VLIRHGLMAEEKSYVQDVQRQIVRDVYSSRTLSLAGRQESMYVDGASCLV